MKLFRVCAILVCVITGCDAASTDASALLSSNDVTGFATPVATPGAEASVPRVALDVGDVLAPRCDDLEDPACCPVGQTLDCSGQCALPQWELSDGTCQSRWDCATFDFDGGDCLGSDACREGMMQDCFGRCVSSRVLGNGFCNPTLDCDEHAFDGGDCQALNVEDGA